MNLTRAGNVGGGVRTAGHLELYMNLTRARDVGSEVRTVVDLGL